LNTLPARSHSSKLFCLIVFLALLTVSFWTYRSGIVSVPRSDHYGFMAEREFAVSDLDYLIKELAYNRTRVIAKGDGYLFRPGMTGVLALLDILFRHNLYALGIFSILLHGLVAFSIFVLIARHTSRGIAFGAATVFAAHLAGFEMVFWRHISPYMFCLLFFSFALVALSDWMKRSAGAVSLVCSSFCFFLSCLFHEVALIVLTAGFVLFFVLSLSRVPDSKNAPASFKSVAWVCLIPILAYLIINFSVFIFYHAQFSLQTASDASKQGIGLVLIIKNLLLVAGLFVTAFLMPSLIHYSFSNLDFRAEWNFLRIPDSFFLVAGSLLFITTVSLLIYLFKRRKNLFFSARASVLIFMGIFFFSTFFGVVFGRVVPRSINYLQNSTYYFYITNYALIVIAAISAGSLFDKFSSGLSKWISVFVLTGFAAYQVVNGIIGIERALKPRHQYDQAVAQKTLKIWSELKRYPDYCYGGTGSESVSRHVPNILLYRKSCNALPEKTPLYLLENGQGELWFMKLAPEPSGQHLLQHGSLDEEGKIHFSHKETNEKIQGHGFLLSASAHKPVFLEARIHGGFVGGLVFGYQDIDNFSILVANERYTYIQTNQNGVHSEPSHVAQQILNPISFMLSVQKIGDQFVVFYNRTLLAIVTDNLFPGGQLGLYRKPGSSPGDYFTDVALLDAHDTSQGRVGTFKPVFRFQF